jgi:predicted transcriptional regulator
MSPSSGDNSRGYVKKKKEKSTEGVTRPQKMYTEDMATICHSQYKEEVVSSKRYDRSKKRKGR